MDSFVLVEGILSPSSASSGVSKPLDPQIFSDVSSVSQELAVERVSW